MFAKTLIGDEGAICHLTTRSGSTHSNRLVAGIACLAATIMTTTGWGSASIRTYQASSPQRFVRVSTSEQGDAYGACALMKSGALTCWYEGYAEPAPAEHDFTQVSVGGENDDRTTDNYACGLRRNHTAACWSISPLAGQALPAFSSRQRPATENQVPSGRFMQVAAGPAAVCAIRMNGSIVCWRDTPTIGTSRPLPSYRFTDISLGGVSNAGWSDYFGCGVRRNGSLACWGKVFYGDTTLEVANPPPGRFLQVDANEQQACALRADHMIVCWDGSGVLPTGLNPSHRFTQVSGVKAFKYMVPS
jgi:hypothetical protein